MQNEKWLNKLIFDTELIDNCFLSEIEKCCLTSFLKDKKTYGVIGKELELSGERVRQLVENSIGKILLNIKDLLAKSYWLKKVLLEKEVLNKELLQLKSKFKVEIAKEQQLTMKFESLDIPITKIPFSVRAKKILVELNITTVSELSNLKVAKLNALQNAGIKTVYEIIRKAEELGIKIN